MGAASFVTGTSVGAGGTRYPRVCGRWSRGGGERSGMSRIDAHGVRVMHIFAPRRRHALCAPGCLPGPAGPAPAQRRHHLRRRPGLRRHRAVRSARARLSADAEPRPHGRRGRPVHELLCGAGRLLGVARGAADRLLSEPRRHSGRAGPHRAIRHQSERDDARRSPQAARLRHGDLRQVAPRPSAAVPAARGTASTSTSACRTRTTCGRSIRRQKDSIPTCR